MPATFTHDTSETEEDTLDVQTLASRMLLLEWAAMPIDPTFETALPTP
jgi:hypothetical protein